MIDVQEGENEDLSKLGQIVKSVAESNGHIVDAVNLAESKYELLNTCITDFRFNDLKAMDQYAKDPNKAVHPIIREDLPKLRRAHYVILTFTLGSKLSQQKIEEYLNHVKTGKGLGGKKRVAYFVTVENENPQQALNDIKGHFKKNILSMGYKPAKFSLIKKGEIDSEYTRGNIHYDFKNLDNTE